jgi:predicted Zn-dependent protease
MRRHTLTLLALLLGATPTFAQTALPLANEELLHSARNWEARERGDLAVLALEKLVAARPDSSDALLELGELYLRMPDIAAAGRVRELLNRRFQGSPAAQTFEIEYRFATRDRLQLASLQRLRQLDRNRQLRAELQRLFPSGAPGGMLSIEYYRLLAGTPGGHALAVAGLRELAAIRPEDPRVQLALARLLLRRPETRQEGVRRLQALTQRDDVKLLEVDASLLTAFKDLDTQTPAHVLHGYLARHPADPLATRLLAAQSRAIEAQRALFGDAPVMIPPDLQQQLLDELSALLLNATTQLLLALRADTIQSEPHAHADATHAAAVWLGRAHRSAARGQVELATAQLAAARALRRGEFDTLVALADRMAALAELEQSGALLALATEFAPRSAWLFATYVRWLLGEQRESEALALLEARILDAQWTATGRDELRASALEQRAQRALAAGDREQAIADLELAVRYAPLNPWSRYRLAGLYARGGEPDRGRELFAHAAASAEMRYAQSLYASSIDALDAAFAAIDAIPAPLRSPGMQAQHDRLRTQLARRDAREQHRAGDAQLARATLRAVEALASQDPELTRELAFAWIEIDEPQQALELIDAQQRGGRSDDRELLLIRAEILDRLAAVEPLAAVLEQLCAIGEAPHDAQVARWQRSLDLRVIRNAIQEGQYTRALSRLDELLAGDPHDRTLRSVRADLDLTLRQPRAARDRYAALLAEDPDDLETRLSYIRALTAAGDVAIARAQLRSVQEKVAADATELQLDIARRQLALNDAPGAVRTLEAVHARQPERADVLLALGRAELSQRNFTRARAWFARAERSPDAKLAVQARRAGEQLDLRLQSHVESGFEVRSKPGDDGISRYDAVVVPNAWRHALGFERRLRAHADAISVDSGRLSLQFDDAALLGTLQAAGPTPTRRLVNQPQSGLALGLGYETDTWSADLGTSGLGLLLPNIVGGIEWSPKLGPLDITLGLERRAVTSSVLSFAGMRDPITGAKWGGVAETGPYAQLGLYRKRYSLSAALRFTDLSGVHVADNRFMGLRGAADWQFFARDNVRAYVGVTLNHWNYQRNLQNYTFGNGGYYSPQSYLSIAMPLELQGTWRGWSYQLRTTISNSTSRIEHTAFYPIDPQLQAAAATSVLPSGFNGPFFAASSGGGLSLSAYAAIERQVTPHLVLGGKLDLDRSDFYEPTVLMFYLRHVFGRTATQLAVPPWPVRAYNQ